MIISSLTWLPCQKEPCTAQKRLNSLKASGGFMGSPQGRPQSKTGKAERWNALVTAPPCPSRSASSLDGTLRLQASLGAGKAPGVVGAMVTQKICSDSAPFVRPQTGVTGFHLKSFNLPAFIETVATVGGYKKGTGKKTPCQMHRRRPKTEWGD